uniref:Keratinocyte proline-rich protein-like n=1 Tax=Steinernema glaseri TaxID=37863 RepID=A0A1I8A9G1_9BILA
MGSLLFVFMLAVGSTSGQILNGRVHYLNPTYTLQDPCAHPPCGSTVVHQAPVYQSSAPVLREPSLSTCTVPPCYPETARHVAVFDVRACANPPCVQSAPVRVFREPYSTPVQSPVVQQPVIYQSPTCSNPPCAQPRWERVLREPSPAPILQASPPSHVLREPSPRVLREPAPSRVLHEPSTQRVLREPYLIPSAVHQTVPCPNCEQSAPPHVLRDTVPAAHYSCSIPPCHESIPYRPEAAPIAREPTYQHVPVYQPQPVLRQPASVCVTPPCERAPAPVLVAREPSPCVHPPCAPVVREQPTYYYYQPVCAQPPCAPTSYGYQAARAPVYSMPSQHPRMLSSWGAHSAPVEPNENNKKEAKANK